MTDFDPHTDPRTDSNLNSSPGQTPVRHNIRFKREVDAELVNRAAAKSGLSVAEWMRRALIKTAEEQIHHTGLNVQILRNLLFIRRTVELDRKVTPETVLQAKAWAKVKATDATRVGDTPGASG